MFCSSVLEGDAFFGRRWRLLGHLCQLDALAAQRNDPFAIFQLANDQLRLEHRAFGDYESSLCQWTKRKANAQSLSLGKVDIGICRIGDGDAANDKAAPRQIHAAPDIDFPAERAFGRVTDALLNAIGLQIEIDAEENERGQATTPAAIKRKRLAKISTRGSYETFPECEA